MQLKNARVWVTGGASGMGEALIAPLLDRGARVAITDRRAEALAVTASRYTRGQPVVAVPGDVTDRDAMHAVVAQVEQALGGIDIAILNAGITGQISALSLDVASIKRVFDVNFFGALYGLEAVLPGMLQRGSGQVVAVASLAGYRGLPKMAGYGASKAALIHAFDSFRFELAPRGIQVTLVTPGFVRTEMTSSNDPRPAIVDAAVAARIILDGVADGRHEVHFPARLSWLIKALRVLPYPIYERIITARERRGGLGFHHDAPH